MLISFIHSFVQVLVLGLESLGGGVYWKRGGAVLQRGRAHRFHRMVCKHLRGLAGKNLGQCVQMG